MRPNRAFQTSPPGSKVPHWSCFSIVYLPRSPIRNRNADIARCVMSGTLMPGEYIIHMGMQSMKLYFNNAHSKRTCGIPHIPAVEGNLPALQAGIAPLIWSEGRHREYWSNRAAKRIQTVHTHQPEPEMSMSGTVGPTKLKPREKKVNLAENLCLEPNRYGDHLELVWIGWI